jgi:hypothetical protein
MTELLKKIVPVKLHRLLRLAGSDISVAVIPRVTTSRAAQTGVVLTSPTTNPKRVIRMIGPRHLDDNNKRSLTETGLHPSSFEIS